MKCQKCGKCCVESVIFFFKPQWDELKECYPVQCKNAISKAKNYNDYFIVFFNGCGFLDMTTKHCAVYSDRPDFCKAFPFLKAEENIIKVTFTCPAIPSLDKNDLVRAKPIINKSITDSKKYRNMLNYKSKGSSNAEFSKFVGDLNLEDDEHCTWYPADDFIEMIEILSKNDLLSFIDFQKKTDNIYSDKEINFGQKIIEIKEDFEKLPDSVRTALMKSVSKWNRE